MSALLSILIEQLILQQKSKAFILFLRIHMLHISAVSNYAKSHNIN